jgi:mono/diheme cytochrome c family protein
MDFQPKFGPQESNPFFEDNAAMRTPVPGTVPRGAVRTDAALYEGRTDGGNYVAEMPIAVNRAVLERGQDRYDVYCAVCHGKTGAGNGVIMRQDYGYTPASSYHIDRLRTAPDGYLYDVINNGVRNMSLSWTAGPSWPTSAPCSAAKTPRPTTCPPSSRPGWA